MTTNLIGPFVYTVEEAQQRFKAKLWAVMKK